MAAIPEAIYRISGPEATQWAQELQGTPAAYQACYNYSPQGEGEIDLKENEVIRVMEKFDEHGDTDWWKVERSDGVVGIVPSTYLENIGGYVGHAEARTLELSKTNSFESEIQGARSVTSPEQASPLAPSVPQYVPHTLQDQLEADTARSELSSFAASQNNWHNSQTTMMQPPANGHLELQPPSDHTSLSRSVSSLSANEENWAGSDVTPLKDLDPRVNGPDPFISIAVGAPRKSGTLIKVVTWVVETQTNLPGFGFKRCGVRRKYSDFLWLHDILEVEMPCCLIPPLVHDSGKVGLKSKAEEEHYIFKRSITAQNFLNRLGQRSIFSSHPMFHLMLQGTAAELKRAKKAKITKPPSFKHPPGNQKPDRDQMLAGAITYMETLVKQLKQMQGKGSNKIAVLKESGNVHNFYYSDWQTIANHEQGETYTRQCMASMAEDMKSLEIAWASQLLYLERTYRQNIKDLKSLLLEAEAYIERLWDQEDTVTYWNLECQKLKELLDHKTVTLNVLSQTSQPPQHYDMEQYKDGPEAAHAAALAAKLEKKEMKEYKKQQRQQRDVDKRIKEVGKKLDETQNHLSTAQSRLAELKAVVWRELLACDQSKEIELQSIHQTWIGSCISLNKLMYDGLSKLSAKVGTQVTYSHADAAGWPKATA